MPMQMVSFYCNMNELLALRETIKREWSDGHTIMRETSWEWLFSWNENYDWIIKRYTMNGHVSYYM